MQALNDHVKAASQEALSYSVEIISTVVGSATKASELVFSAAKESAEGLVSSAKGFEGWTPDANWANPTEAIAPVLGKASKYGKASLQLASETTEALAAQSQAAVKAMSQQSEALMDEATAAIPQAEPVVKNIKAVMAQSLAFYEQAFGVASQAQRQFFAAGDQFFAQGFVNGWILCFPGPVNAFHHLVTRCVVATQTGFGDFGAILEGTFERLQRTVVSGGFALAVSRFSCLRHRGNVSGMGCKGG